MKACGQGSPHVFCRTVGPQLRERCVRLAPNGLCLRWVEGNRYFFLSGKLLVRFHSRLAPERRSTATPPVLKINVKPQAVRTQHRPPPPPPPLALALALSLSLSLTVYTSTQPAGPSLSVALGSTGIRRPGLQTLVAGLREVPGLQELSLDLSSDNLGRAAPFDLA